MTKPNLAFKPCAMVGELVDPFPGYLTIENPAVGLAETVEAIDGTLGGVTVESTSIFPSIFIAYTEVE